MLFDIGDLGLYDRLIFDAKELFMGDKFFFWSIKVVIVVVLVMGLNYCSLLLNLRNSNLRLNRSSLRLRNIGS